MPIILTTPVKDLRGVGPAKLAGLRRLGIHTVDDLLHWFPSGYFFAPERTDGPLIDGQPATAAGIVRSVRAFNRNFEAVLDSGVRIMWFGGMYLRESIFKGSRLMVSGVVTYGGFTNPEWRVGEAATESDLNTVTYPVTSGITSKDIGRLVRQVFDLQTDAGVSSMLRGIHRPRTQAEADAARQWFKFDELLFFQLALAVRQARREQQAPNVRCIPVPHNIGGYFPFEFTADQRQAIDEVTGDLYSPRAMNRLLQGEVGCGKTAVAAYAAIVMAFNGGQTAILCPTEILARQHYETVKGYFERAGVKCKLVTGAPMTIIRESQVTLPVPQIFVGTTALLSERVTFSNLGLVIVDEEHRFGNEQRAALKRHGNPHLLTMSATPIPRSLAMTVFGDWDMSTIRSMPPGRKSVMTERHNNLDEQVRAKIRDELSAGHQVYVVCPRIEALDDEMRAVEEVANEYYMLFRTASIDMLHGQMTPQRKQQVAEWWAKPYCNGKILVSTTVIEVGVDNPNATVMVIEGAERFGLAQLHQLRGRVGRGKDQSYCFLLSDTDSTEARARLRAMEKTNDGFEIAEADLRQRGPGDIFSPRQHGLPDLRIADIVQDFDLLLEARKEARELMAGDPDLTRHPEIKKELERRYADRLHFADA